MTVWFKHNMTRKGDGEMKKYVSVMLVVGMMAVSTSAEERPRTNAIPEIVVSATRMESDAEAVASSVTVVTRDEMERKQDTTVMEVLRDIPGVQVVQNGGPGTTANVFIRGAQSEQILVLVDGIEVNDPISPGRGARLSDMDLDNVERIEVLRGAQSGLYGSDAIAGVISITTKKGEGPAQSYVSAEAGSYNTFEESAGVSGGSRKFNYSVGVSRADSDGFSAADEHDGNTEKDGYERSSASARVGVQPVDIFGVDLIARYVDSESEFDSGGGVGGDDPTAVEEKQSLFMRAVGNLDLLQNLWRQSLGVSWAMNDRSSYSGWGDSTFDSQLLKEDWQHNFYLGDDNILTAGTEFSHEEGKTDSIESTSMDSWGVFLQDLAKLSESFSVALGSRFDSYESFGDETTYRVGPVYMLKETGTRFKATYGTGFKAPSLYQLYAPATEWGLVGNENLRPEKSEGWDAGIEQKLFEDKALLGVTYFSTEFEDMIDFADGYVNQAEVETKGVEAFSRVQVTDPLRVDLSYTYTDAKDKITDEDLPRRPKHRASAGMNYQWRKKTNVNLSVLYVGKRDDRDYGASMFGYTEVEMPQYTVVNVAISHDLSETVQLFGRVDNLFDEQYQEVVGYGTPGLSGYAGVKVSL
jgi:vitamin B12 transporter